MDKLNISTLGVLFSMLILPALGFAAEPDVPADPRWVVDPKLVVQVETTEELNRVLNGSSRQACISSEDCRYRLKTVGPTYSDPKNVILGLFDRPNKVRVYEQDGTQVYFGQGKSGAGFRYLGVETHTAF